jgi:bifunctional non-homologous end joining protein LigD
MNLKPVKPFEPVRADRVPAGDGWIAQVKWDGVRMLTYCDGTETRLINRRLHDRTRQYPELADPTAWCSATSFVLDGEVIAIRGGKPSFYQIMKRDNLRHEAAIRLAAGREPATYMIFDLLYLNGEWLTSRPLRERQERLAEIVRPRDNVQLVDSVADGERLLAVMKQFGMEGIVCKELSSAYAPGGKDGRWRKVKLMRDLVAAVGGVTLRNGIVNALLLGLFAEDGRFLYIGHAGTGKLGRADWRELTGRLLPLTLPRRPFANEPQRTEGAVWVRPEIAVKVQFLEWTPQGTMRHPSIQAIVDIPAEECRFPD